MNSMKMQKKKDMTLKGELLRLVGAPGCSWRRAEKSSKRDEEAEPKQKQRPFVAVSGSESKVDAVKYNIAYWNLECQVHGKREVVKQEMARVSNDIPENQRTKTYQKGQI